MKRTLKVLAALLGAVIVISAVFVINAVWFRPWSLNVFYEKVFIQHGLRDPELLTMLGIAEKFGYRAHNARLTDVSIEHTQREIAHAKQARAHLNAYNFAKQTPSQQLSTRVLAWYLDHTVEAEKFAFHNYPVNQFFGVQNTLPDFMANIHLVPDAQGAEHYLSRLAEWGPKFDQVIAGLKYREERGILPPRIVVQRVLEEMRLFSGTPHGQNLLYTSFATKVAGARGISAADTAKFKGRVEDAIAKQVYPAYERLIAYFAALEPKTTPDAGVWRLPDGDAFYAFQLRKMTTTRMTPAEVHELGRREIMRIENEMRAILGRLGHTDGTPAESIAKLRQSPQFHFSNDDAGRSAALAEYKRIIDECLAITPRYFAVQPKANVEVRRMPEFKEAGGPGAYYSLPARDGTRPGVFFANLRDMAEVDKFGMKTLAYHEGVPGHHFQIALAQELRGLPTFRTLLPFAAYGEGWALYAEWLASEMGLYRNDPYGDLGRLDGELFRAIRLVVDTGLHHQRWTREQAIAFMSEKLGRKEADVTSEVERYMVSPGQACAYMVGMLKFRELRARAKQKLGPGFSDRAFHQVVLGNGALPLEILEELVNEWLDHAPRSQT